MNVVVYLGDAERGETLGVAHYAANLVRALALRRGGGVTLVGGTQALRSYADLSDVRLVDEATLSRQRQALEGENDLLIQIHQFQPRLLSLPTVVVVHDLHIYDVHWKYGGGGRLRARRALHKNVIRAEAVVSHFPATCDRLPEIEPLAAGKTFLTMCPPLIEDFDLTDEAVAAVCRRFALDDGRPTILYPAQRQFHKNHWNLLTAVHEMHGSDYDVRLICPGTALPDYWAGVLQQRVDYLGLRDVHFPGYVTGEELRALYHKATAVVSPSLAEGGAYLAQEAVVHDTAVACSAIESALAHLARMKLDVPTFDPFDIDALAKTLAQLVDDPEGVVAGFGPAKEIMSGWTWEGLAEEVVGSVERVRR